MLVRFVFLHWMRSVRFWNVSLAIFWNIRKQTDRNKTVSISVTSAKPQDRDDLGAF